MKVLKDIETIEKKNSETSHKAG